MILAISFENTNPLSVADRPNRERYALGDLVAGVLAIPANE